MTRQKNFLLCVSIFFISACCAFVPGTASADALSDWLTATVDPTIFNSLQVLQNKWLKAKPLLHTNKSITFKISKTGQKVTFTGNKKSPNNPYLTVEFNTAAPITALLNNTVKTPTRFGPPPSGSPFLVTAQSRVDNITQGQIPAPIKLQFVGGVALFNSGKKFKVFSLDTYNSLPGLGEILRATSTTMTINARPK